MIAQKLEAKNTTALCQAVVTRLLSSVEASYQLNGIADKQSILYHLTYAQIEYWHHSGEVWVIDENQGMLAGHYKKDVGMVGSLRMVLNALYNIQKDATKEDRRRLIKNFRKSSGAHNMKWRDQVCQRSDYYYIDLIAIDCALKGSGAFRELLMPVIQRAEREHIPLLLDTHDKNNLPIYQRFGFELVCEHYAKRDQAIIQYSMIKRP